MTEPKIVTKARELLRAYYQCESLEVRAEALAEALAEQESAERAQREADMSQHTPGPWVIVVEEDDDREFLVFPVSMLKDGVIEARKMDDFVACAGLNHPNFEANARLISAAPDLLEALCEMLAPSGPRNDMEIVNRAKSAIAKAKGGDR